MDREENLSRVVGWLLHDAGYKKDIPDSLEEKQRMMRALMNIREPRPVSDDFLTMQDAELQCQLEEKGVVEIAGEGILLWQGDITRLKVDAIVNAANAQMLGCFAPLHACIDNCIHSSAGIQLRQECNELMQGRLLDTGDAKITCAYNLPASYVIHTVGPICQLPAIPGRAFVPPVEQQEQLAACYRNCLLRVEEKHLQSIAFCCISTGVFHFPNELAARIAVGTVRKYLDTHPESSVKTVVFNVFTEKDLLIYQRALGMFHHSPSTFHLQSLIDESDAVLIGAGAGLTAAAGIDYAGADFKREFADFIKRYGFTDLYTSSFHPFESEEERWAYWSKHVMFARFLPPALPLYQALLRRVKGKDCFVITTNVDGQFVKAGFDPSQIFEVQGDYAYIQSSYGTDQKRFFAEDLIRQMCREQRDCRIPSSLVPHYLKGEVVLGKTEGEPMDINVHKDAAFVQDEQWQCQADRYYDFVNRHRDSRLLLLELGVGFNTPSIIRFPFERMAQQFPQTTLVRFNRDYPQPGLEGLERFYAFRNMDLIMDTSQ